MKVNLEILEASYLLNHTKIEPLNTKIIVPNMIFRRRFTTLAKLLVELFSTQNRVIYGTNYGELQATAKILNAICAHSLPSPSEFQNSVYNTAISYASILHKNTSEIMTLSCGDETSLKVLRCGAIKALDGDELVLVCAEALNIPNIEQVNKCGVFLESAVYLKVKHTNESPTQKLVCSDTNVPKSISHILRVAQNFREGEINIIEVEI